MNLLLNLTLLLLLILFGIYRLTKESPEKRSTLLKNLKNTPKNFYQNCKLVLEKLKNREL